MLFGSALAQAGNAPTYYLALGDSLAQGVQPLGSPTNGKNSDVETNQGYVDDLYALLRLRNPQLSLTKLGCPGETTSTMISGGICTYAGANDQLDAAVNFLDAHRGQPGLVTLNIGSNDVDRCISLTGVLDECFMTGLGNVKSNIPLILHALQAAAPGTLIVAMNYYNPFLAAWTLVKPPLGDGQTLAHIFENAAEMFNSELEILYSGIPVADVAKAYHISDFTLIPVLNLPLNVFLTRSWTWMGAPAPFGPDIHPNAAGYAVIAGAFAEQIPNSTSRD
jgi:lysophospholipase L1-like esterase